MNPRRVSICALPLGYDIPHSMTVYYLSTSPVLDAPGVCRFMTFQLDPKDVGGNALPIPSENRIRFDQAWMQLAQPCPSQNDPNYVDAVDVSGGVFKMLMSFWQHAARSPADFRQTFSGIKVSASTHTSLGRMAEALKATPKSVKLSTIEFNSNMLFWSGKTAYSFRVTMPSAPFQLTFWVDIFDGRVVPIAVEDRAP